MIYITGDTHNLEDMSNLSTSNMKFCCMQQAADYKSIENVIVLGDFGLPWYNCPVDEGGILPKNRSDDYLLKWYSQKPFQIFAVQGNHENYDMIEKLPQEQMFGGTVLRLSYNVFYLKRGEIYTIEDKSFLVLGGAASTDKIFRIPHESWWEQEEWTKEEQAACLAKIEEHGNKFDYVLSHTGTTKGIALADPYYSDEARLAELQLDSTVCFNDKIDSLITYKKWFFGHWHSDWGYENYAKSKYVLLYHEGIVINGNSQNALPE